MKVSVSPQGVAVFDDNNVLRMTVPAIRCEFIELAVREEHWSTGFKIHGPSSLVDTTDVLTESELVLPELVLPNRVKRAPSPYKNGKLPSPAFEAGYLEVIGDGGTFKSLQRKFRKSSEAALRFQMRAMKDRYVEQGKEFKELTPCRRKRKSRGV